MSYYQHRWNVGIDSPAYQAQQAALRAAHTVGVPTNLSSVAMPTRVPSQRLSRKALERFYAAGYERFEFTGVGHFPHREQPTAVADLIACVLSMLEGVGKQ